MLDTNFSMHYDRHGQPMSLEAWAQAMEKPRHVGLTKLWFGRVRISTVWLGIDHSFERGGPPLIFESMVFFGKSRRDYEVRRYSTEEAAVDGHYALVDKYRNLWNVLRELRS